MGIFARLGQGIRRLVGRDNGIRISYGPNAFHYGELYLPKKKETETPTPVVILIHGGFWRSAYSLSLMRKLARDLAHNGIAAWNIEYRRIGNAEGGWPNTMLDVALAADYVRTLAPQYSLDMQKVVTVGHSAGGHLAVWLAARPRITEGELYTTDPLPLVGAVSLAGCVDLDYVAQLNLSNGAAIELLGGEPQDVPERYAVASPAALLPLGTPQVLIHGTRDDRVPFNVSQVYAHTANEAGDDITLIELPGADHFVVIDPTSESWAITLKEIQHLFDGEEV